MATWASRLHSTSPFSNPLSRPELEAVSTFHLLYYFYVVIHSSIEMVNNDDNNADQSVPQNPIYDSFGGWDNFMISYGLKPWDDDDIEEGIAIVEAMEEGDKHDWDERQKEMAGKK
jgi:hypothetical protein